MKRISFASMGNYDGQDFFFIHGVITLGGGEFAREKRDWFSLLHENGPHLIGRLCRCETACCGLDTATRFLEPTVL
jgi:hypothetical protein